MFTRIRFIGAMRGDRQLYDHEVFSLSETRLFSLSETRCFSLSETRLFIQSETRLFIQVSYTFHVVIDS